MKHFLGIQQDCASFDIGQIVKNRATFILKFGQTSLDTVARKAMDRALYTVVERINFKMILTTDFLLSSAFWRTGGAIANPFKFDKTQNSIRLALVSLKNRNRY